MFIKINFIIKNDEGQIIGGIVGTKYFLQVASIDLLWVDEGQRGKGLGTQLMNLFEEKAKELNCF